MPSFNNVSYNSSRVQRAYRINKLETMKLNHRIQLLEKERLHRQRLTNQDIRTVSLTLDYIQTCSGHSPEALAPGGGRVEDDDVRVDSGPCFLYGERIVSRKKRRTLRPQSAMDKSSSRINSETASVVSTTEITPRPQSSPARRSTFVTHLNRDDTESVFGSQSESSKSGASTPKGRFVPAWTEEPMPDVTKILLRASAENNTKRNSIFDRSKDSKNGGSAALKTLTRSLRIKSQTEAEGLSLSQITEERSSSISPERRGSRIGDFLKRGSSAGLSSSALKTQLSQTLSGPITSSMQRQYIMDSKKAVNNDKTKVIQKRVNKFVTDSSLI